MKLEIYSDEKKPEKIVKLKLAEWNQGMIQLRVVNDEGEGAIAILSVGAAGTIYRVTHGQGEASALQLIGFRVDERGRVQLHSE